MLLPPESILAYRHIPDGKGQLGVVVECEPSITSGLENAEATDASCWRDSYQGKNPFNIHPFPVCLYEA